MKTALEILRKIVVYGIWFGAITLVFFLPMPFHHNIRVGTLPLFSSIYLDGEGMSPGGYLWHGYQVHFFIGRFLISVFLWLVLIVAVYKWLRYLDSKSYLRGPDASA
jgi:hypothetical protein